MRPSLSLVFCGVLALSHSVAAAQLQGVVTDTGGAGIAGATVELWNSSGVVAARLTHRDGTFRFTVAEGAGARRVSARRLGYGSAMAELPSDSGPVTLRLPTEAIALEGVVATSAPIVRHRCPQRDDPLARALWEEAAASYSAPDLSHGFATATRSVARSVPESEKAHFTEAGMRPRWLNWSPGSWDRFGLISHAFDGSADEVAYAVPLPWDRPGYQVLDEEFFAWHYPKFHEFHASHFFSPGFGDRHTFALLDHAPPDAVIGFCPRSSAGPRVTGRLRLLGARARSAYWEFHTPRPGELAGGEAVFVLDSLESPQFRHLLPVQSTYWRRIAGSRRFYQRSTLFLGWEIIAPQSVPHHGESGHPSR